ncbi:hypothetical protein M514_23505 [Trichuris suis]|uniref:Uncharacterized protein n=1 Tax=Trichuris suis TaxID=68888 RepID=A0A085N4E1_9BILA|nr:hypothetical protein M514_23505 [Trichuris suis]
MASGKTPLAKCDFSEFHVKERTALITTASNNMAAGRVQTVYLILKSISREIQHDNLSRVNSKR